MLLPLPHSKEGFEKQFSRFSEGLSKFFFGHWLSFHPFSVQCLYRTIFRGILCLLSQLTQTYEQVLSENLASLAMVCSVLLKKKCEETGVGDSDPLCNTTRKAFNWQQLHLSSWQWSPKHGAALSHGSASPELGPQHYWSSDLGRELNKR